jgi:hypothetical protein
LSSKYFENERRKQQKILFGTFLSLPISPSLFIRLTHGIFSFVLMPGVEKHGGLQRQPLVITFHPMRGL